MLTIKVPILRCAGEKVFKFYWFDAYEDSFSQPGSIFNRFPIQNIK